MNRTFMSMLGRGLALGLVLLASALQAIAKDYKYQTRPTEFSDHPAVPAAIQIIEVKVFIALHIKHPLKF